MDTRAFFETVCQVLDEAGMDIPYSHYDREDRYILSLQAINTQTGQRYHIEMRKDEPIGTAAD